MTKNNLIDSYLDDLSQFAPDFQLIVHSKTLDMDKRPALAAAAQTISIGDQKLGILTARDDELMVRVFLDQQKGHYKLYFICPDQGLKWGVVTAPDSFKYAVINDHDLAILPLDFGIDPFLDNLSISLPQECFEFELKPDLANPTVLQKSNNQISLTVKSSDVFHELIILNQMKGELENASKAMVTYVHRSSQDIEHRLAGLRNARASFSLPVHIQGPMTLCFYK